MDDVITNNYGNASVLDLNNCNGITLEEPDLQQMREERLKRTRALMKTVDPAVTAAILPQHANNASLEDSAAICIQAHFRGYLGRKVYCEQLYRRFEQEETARDKKTEGQVEEGELLIENHRLQVQFDDNSTTRRNKERRNITKVITIQRAWRTYQRRKHLDQSPQPSDPDDASDSSSVDHPMSLSDGSDSEPASQVKSCVGVMAKHVVIEAEPESMASDYSEMADFVKEHLANVHIIRKDDLATGNTQLSADRFTVEQKVPRFPGETDDEYNKRLRKLNYLSLAQEFAELKKVDADALPFDLPCDRTLTDFSPTSDGSDADTPSAVATTGGLVDVHVVPPGVLVDAQVVPPGGSVDAHVAPPGVPTEAWTEVTGGSVNSDRSGVDAAGDVGVNHPQACGAGPCDNTADKSSPVPATADRRSQSAPGTTDSMSRDAPQPNDESKCMDGGLVGAPVEGVAAPGGGAMEFDVYNIETTLPEMDWARLEQQLELAAAEESKRKSRRNDREEIRRRLAMGFDEDYYGGQRVAKKPSLQTRLQGGMNLQICFVNEAALADQSEAGGASLDASQVAPSQPTEPAPPSGAVAPPVGPTHTAVRSEKKMKKKKKEEEEDLVTRQARLQAEATMALAQVRPMAHMQLQVEKQLRKKSPIAEIVGIPGVGDGTRVRFGRQRLEQMNVARLQVILNDLHTQIENLNEELVQMLVERDDLHMEQDSKLVDIEDLTRRAQELTSKVNTDGSREKKKTKKKK